MIGPNLTVEARRFSIIKLAGYCAGYRARRCWALQRTAFHEAGHVVAARALGAPVVSASIVPETAVIRGEERQISGHVQLTQDSDAARELRDSRVEIMTDVRGAATLLKLITPAELFDWRYCLGYVRERRAEADGLLGRNWPAVEAVAAALLKRQMVGRHEIDAVLSRYGLEGWKPLRIAA